MLLHHNERKWHEATHIGLNHENLYGYRMIGKKLFITPIKQKKKGECTKSNIWEYKQNKPSLIIKDIVEKYPDIDEEFLYEVLLKRGVFKWLAVRRDLIKLKEKWREEIRDLNEKSKTQKEKGILNTLVRCRQEIRKLCHSERWRAPDFDRKANKFLNERN